MKFSVVEHQERFCLCVAFSLAIMRETFSADDLQLLHRIWFFGAKRYASNPKPRHLTPEFWK